MEGVVTTEAISRAKLQSNHHHQQTNIQFFNRPDALPVTQPTVSLRKKQCLDLDDNCQSPMDITAVKCRWTHNDDLLTAKAMPPGQVYVGVNQNHFRHAFPVSYCTNISYWYYTDPTACIYLRTIPTNWWGNRKKTSRDGACKWRVQLKHSSN